MADFQICSNDTQMNYFLKVFEARSEFHVIANFQFYLDSQVLKRRKYVF